MDRFFDIKRTKMVDEASAGHVRLPLTSSILRFVLVFMIGSLISSFIQSIPLVMYIFLKTDLLATTLNSLSGNIGTEQMLAEINDVITNLPPIFTVVSLFCTVATAIASVFYCLKIEKRRLPSMGFRKGKAGMEYLTGMLIGLLMYGLTFLIAYASGSVSVKLNPDGIAPIIILFFLGYVVQGAAEEILTRGYLMVSIARDYKPWIAIIFSASMFMILHAGNPSVSPLALINILLYGILMGIYVFKRGNIWGACAIHSMWNFAQGNIFGSYVSGTALMPSLFVMEYDPARVWANGGAFGLEGGISATIVLLVSIGIALTLKTNKNEISVLELSIDNA